MTTTPVLIGKRILVGLTYLDANGDVERQVQLHGVIHRVTGGTLHFQRADGEGEFSIPLDGPLHPAEPQAVYRLRGTGESVSDVDFLSTWTIHPSQR